VRIRVNDRHWWAAHGVSEEVRIARAPAGQKSGYTRWTKERKRTEPILTAYAGLGPSQRRRILRWARLSSGLVIYRHPWFGEVDQEDLRYVHPEIRPDDRVKVKHTDEEGRKYLFPPSLTRWTFWFHEGPRPTPRDAYQYVIDQMERGESYVDPGEVFREMKAQGRVVETHPEHFDPSRYPGWRKADERRREWLKEKAEEKRQAHLRTHHQRKRQRDKKVYYETHVESGGRLDGWHWHYSRVKQREEVLAKRLDLNPIMRERIREREPEWWTFALEGCIKADALVTYVLDHDLPAGVVSVPSVGQWEATYPREDEKELEPGDELTEFAYHNLVGRKCFIIPDADALPPEEGFSSEDDSKERRTAEAVMGQAILCRMRLEKLGVEAYIAAPPRWEEMPGARRVRNKDRDLEWPKMGIDDFLGRWGGDLGDLLIYDVRPRSAEEIRAWLLARREEWPDRRKLDRAVAVLQALSTAAVLPKREAKHEGVYAGSLRMLERATGVTRQRISKAIEDLLPLGAVGPPGLNLSERRERWLTNRGAIETMKLLRGEGIEAIEIHPDLTAHEVYPRRRLRDVL
jgi:hypothetical protein